MTRLVATSGAIGSKLRITRAQATAAAGASSVRVTALKVDSAGASKLRVTRLVVAGGDAAPITRWIKRSTGLVALHRYVVPPGGGGPIDPPPATWGPYGNLGAYKPSYATSGAPATIGWPTPFGLFADNPASGLTRVNGDQIITVPGTIIEDKEIFGVVDVRTTDVIIRRCIIHGPQTAPSPSTTGAVRFENGAARRGLIEDCTVYPNAPNWNADCIRGHDFTARRCNVFGLHDGFGIMNTSAAGSAYNVVVEGCFIWGHGYRAGAVAAGDGHTHNDGVHVHGGNTMRFEGNNFETFCHPAFSDIPIPYRTDTAAPHPFPGWGQTTAQSLALLPIISQISNITIKNNWFSGAGEGNIHSDVRTFPVPPGGLGTWSGNKFAHSGYPHPAPNGTRYEIHLMNRTLTYVDGGGNVHLGSVRDVDGTPALVAYDA